YNIRQFKQTDRSRMALVRDEDADDDDDDEVDVDNGRPQTVGLLVRKHDPEWYGHECDKLAKQGKIAECVAMLEQRMLLEDKIRPVAYNFNVVLRAIAPLGHVRTAIRLYQKMCELSIPISRTALTYIYNACANAKPVDAQMGIASAEEVRAATAKRGYQPERIHFCTLIKLYARHGTYEDARRIFAQMIAAGYPAEVDAYCNLLQACVNDKDAGCGPAIEARAVTGSSFLERFQS
uniref:Pentacotripeptide-repeat region of PRORP domain-containing protein n=1 Tax=Plectus sambesii TaxID=2011161 RepID=A0A914VL38_9BILA